MANYLAALFGRKQRTVGDYVLLHRIGRGAFAKVLLARHMITGTEVAVKVIRQPAPYRYFEEVRCYKRLNHPNITQLFEVIVTKRKCYLFMEHVSGGDLLQYLERCGPMTEAAARDMFRQLLSAVHYCHQKNVVHRDLKPVNVLLDGEQNLKLADFGFGREFSHLPLTTFCGTLDYMAPEILRGETYDGPKADVWSLGVILYRMLVGRLPFVGDTYGQTKKKVLSGKLDSPPFLSIEGQNLLQRFLTFNPKERPTLEDILQDPWLTMGQEEELSPYREPPWGDIDPQVAARMEALGFGKEEIEQSVTKKKYDRVMATYLILKRTTAQVPCLISRVRPCPTCPDPEPSSRKTEEPALPSSHLGSRTSVPPLESCSSTSSSSLDEERVPLPHPSLAGSSSSRAVPSLESRPVTPSPTLQERVTVPPPSPASRSSTSLLSLESLPDTPSPALQEMVTVPPPSPGSRSSTSLPSLESLPDTTGPAIQEMVTVPPPSPGSRSSTSLPSLEFLPDTTGPAIQEMVIVPPPSPASRSSTSLPSLESLPDTPGPALQGEPAGSPATRSRSSRSSRSSRDAAGGPDGTADDSRLPAAQPEGGTPACSCSSGPSQRRPGVARRLFRFFLRCICPPSLTKMCRRRTRVKPT